MASRKLPEIRLVAFLYAPTFLQHAALSPAARKSMFGMSRYAQGIDQTEVLRQLLKRVGNVWTLDSLLICRHAKNGACIGPDM